ncbi:MAG: ABC transporter permease [Planctomycetes bacterium]|nr:ABC transporter permease [Planctomycetota bacterium]
MNLVLQCIRFREMLIAFTRRELRQRYIGSILGRAWPLLQPLLMIAVYYIVFVNLFDLRIQSEFTLLIAERLGADKAMAQNFNIILLCAGLLPWMMTAEYVVRSPGLILESGSLVKKVRFPSELLPISLLASYLFNFVLLTIILCAITWIFTPFVGGLWWLFFPTMILHGLFLLGLAYLLATVNVFVRDVGQLIPLVVNIWFFLTPIVYTRESLVDRTTGAPKPLSVIFDWNPLAYLVDLYRWSLVYPEAIRSTVGPDGKELVIGMDMVWRHFGIFAACAVGMLILGYRVFMANKHKFADEL